MAPHFVLRRLPAWVVNGITVTLGLALVQLSIGLVAGAQAAQTAIATAVCASLADVVVTTGRVARRVFFASVASTLAGLLFLAVRPFDALLIPTVALIVFAAMLMLSWGPKAGTASFAAALALVFSMSLPASESLRWDHVAWGIVGSVGYWIWAVVTAELLQPTWRNFALAATAENEARLISAIAAQVRRPAEMIWQSGVLEEESALADRLQTARDLVFPNDKGPNARRETEILLHLIDLRDLAMASKLEAPAQAASEAEIELTARVLDGIANALRVIAQHLQTGEPLPHNIDSANEMDALLRELGQTANAERCTTVLRSQWELLLAIRHLLNPTAEVHLSCKRTDLRRYISPDEWRWSSVAANLRPNAPVFRHALRTAITAGVAYALVRAATWAPHPQWIVLTIAAVMQGSLAQTLLRRNARVLGTLAGCVVVTLLTASSSSPNMLAAFFLIASGIAHAFFPIRYSVTAGAAAVMAVLQAHMAAPDAGFSTLERFADTVAGALLGWAASYVLPSWERRGLPAVLQQATAALRAYAAEATALNDIDAPGAPRFARQRAYDAIRAVSAIRSRSLSEPEDVRVPVPQVTLWLSAAYGLMSQLSNLRLSLALHAREQGGAGFAAAMADASKALDGRLETAASRVPTSEGALSAVPHLAARVDRALEQASRLAEQRAQIETLVASYSKS